MNLTRPALPPLGAAALALLLAGCAGTPPAGPVQLRPHQSVALGDGLTLTYDSFSDSRCPPKVRCIWAGKLSYQFVLQGQGRSESFALGPGQESHAPDALHGQRIVLDESSIPPPAAEAQAQALAPYPVTLQIESR